MFRIVCQLINKMRNLIPIIYKAILLGLAGGFKMASRFFVKRKKYLKHRTLAGRTRHFYIAAVHFHHLLCVVQTYAVTLHIVFVAGWHTIKIFENMLYVVF